MYNAMGCCSPWGHKESDMIDWLNSNNSGQSIYRTQYKGRSYEFSLSKSIKLIEEAKSEKSRWSLQIKEQLSLFKDEHE